MKIYYDLTIKDNCFSYSESKKRVRGSAYSTLQKIEYIFAHFNTLKFQGDRKDLIPRLKEIAHVITRQFQEKEKKVHWFVRFLFQGCIAKKIERVQEVSQRIQACVPHCLEHPKETMQHVLSFLSFQDIANFSSVNKAMRRIAAPIKQKIEAPIQNWIVAIRKMTKNERDQHLYVTVSNGDNPNELLCLLVHGANPNAYDKNSNGDRALHWAAYHNDLDSVMHLVKYGARLEDRGYRNMTPIQQAYWNRKQTSLDKCMAVMRYFLAQGADIHQVYGVDGTFLNHAILDNQMPIVHLLLASNANPTQADRLGNCPLHSAAHLGDTTLIRLFLQLDPTGINRPGNCRATPLFYAWIGKRFNRKDTMRLLLKEGADPNARDIQGNSVLDRTVYAGHTELALLLLDNGAEINTLGNGMTPLGWACASKIADVALVRLLLKRGANPNLLMLNGCIALQVAERYKHHLIADELLDLFRN